MKIAVLGAGAFGTALALSLQGEAQVLLWTRSPEHAREMQATRENAKRLPDVALPESVTVSSDPQELAGRDAVLLCVPMQKLRATLRTHREVLQGATLIACCKGIELETGVGPQDIIAAECPEAPCALLTGPSFAQDIAHGLPTALTLACADPNLGKTLQHALSGPALRLYRTTDVTGTALGGALKNVIAIACGAAIGAGLGESARAALITRGNAEMQRMAEHMGADPLTLVGLSGLGDLVLTCTSRLSRNYRLGLAIGENTPFPEGTTVEGAATAQAVADLAKVQKLDLPISTTVAALVEKRLDVGEALDLLLSRSLKEE